MSFTTKTSYDEIIALTSSSEWRVASVAEVNTLAGYNDSVNYFKTSIIADSTPHDHDKFKASMDALGGTYGSSKIIGGTADITKDGEYTFIRMYEGIYESRYIVEDTLNVIQYWDSRVRFMLVSGGTPLTSVFSYSEDEPPIAATTFNVPFATQEISNVSLPFGSSVALSVFAFAALRSRRNIS